MCVRTARVQVVQHATSEYVEEPGITIRSRTKDEVNLEAWRVGHVENKQIRLMRVLR